MTRRLIITSAVLVSTLLTGCFSGPHVRGWIGGNYVEANPSSFIADYFSIGGGPIHVLPDTVKKQQRSALLVTRVFAQTPLAGADIQEGDLLLTLNGIPLTSLRTLRKTIDQRLPGETVTVQIFRNGEILTRQIVVGMTFPPKTGPFKTSLE